MKCKKTKFNSKEAAFFTIDKIAKKNPTDPNIPKYAYLCHCKAWHISRRAPVEDIMAENEKLKIRLKKLEGEIEDNLKSTIDLHHERTANFYLKSELSKIRNEVDQLRKDNHNLIANIRTNKTFFSTLKNLFNKK